MSKTYSIKVLLEVLDKVSSPVSGIARSLQGVSSKADRLASSLDRVGTKLKKIGKDTEDMGKKFSTNLTAPILGIGAIAIKVAGDFEALEADFTTMLGGSVESAKKFTAEIKAMGAATPFETMDLARNAKLLLSFGMAQDQIIPNLKRLGDVAGGNKEKFNSLALTFAQVQSVGKLMGGDLLQMINAGFNPLTEISKRTGKSVSDLKDEMSKGGISAEMVAQAFADATSEGGMFYKSMERSSQTIPGLISTMKDALTSLAGEFGLLVKDSLDLPGVITSITEKLQAFTENMKAFAKEHPKLFKFILIFALILAAMGPVLVVIGYMSTGLGTLSTGLGLVIKAIRFLAPWLTVLVKGLLQIVVAGGPILWAIMAIAVAALLIWKFWSPIKEFFVSIWVKIKELWNNASPTVKALAILFGMMFLPFITGAALLIGAVKWVIDNFEMLKQKGLEVFDTITKKVSALINAVKSGGKWLGGLLGIGDEDRQKTSSSVARAQRTLSGSTENRSEVTVRVQADENSTASISEVKSKRGRQKVRVKNNSRVGTSFVTAESN